VNANGPRALVIGSSGGIGGAICTALRERGHDVLALSRSGDCEARIDLEDEASIAAAAERLRSRPPLSLIVVASGLLHDSTIRPERALRDLDRDRLLRLFSVNAIGPMLAAKHFVPLMPRGERAIFAALSARVGSIGDNRLGGWYGYRASKAALNMLIKTLAIEVCRTRSQAICVGLHPGTVDTELSKPFHSNVRADKLFTPDRSANHLLDVLDGLTPADTGMCFDWAGAPIVP
jgi:NAD(P)-dependent dehydrogenase (short-subunit alcohol dehydrogenase family)